MFCFVVFLTKNQLPQNFQLHWNIVLCGRGGSSLPQVVSMFNSQGADVGHLQARLSIDDADESGAEHKSYTTEKGTW